MPTYIVYVRLSNGKYLVVRVQLIGNGFKITGFYNNESMAPEVWGDDRINVSELEPVTARKIHNETRHFEVGQLMLAPDEDVNLNDVVMYSEKGFTREIRIV